MTTAVGDIVHNFVGATNESPWSEGTVAFSNSNWEIDTDQLEPNTTTWGVEVCYYTGSVTATTIESQVEIVGTPDYQRVGAAVINSSGNGYALAMGYGTSVRIYIINAWVLGSQLVSEYDTLSHTSGDRYKLSVDTTTGTDNINLYHESTLMLTASDSTYTTGLKPATFGLRESSSWVGVSSWGLTIGSSSPTGTGVGTLQAITGTAVGNIPADFYGPGVGTLTAISGDARLVSAPAGYEIVNYLAPTPDPGTTESLPEGTLADFGITATDNDAWVIESHANITWLDSMMFEVYPPGTHSLDYNFWDYSSATYQNGTINISQQYGVGSGVLQAITGSSTGTFSAPFGTAAGTLQAITGISNGGFTNADAYGGGIGLLSPITGDSTAFYGPFGVGDGSLQAITGNASGASVTSVLGHGAGVLHAVEGAGIGSAPLTQVVKPGHELVIKQQDNELRVI